jgi:serine protease Do
MKPIKVLIAAGAIASVLAVAWTAARPVYAQNRERDRIQEFRFQASGSRIGVTARDLEAAEAERLKITGGVWLETVMPDGPAAKAGLRADDVIVEFDGERVRSLRQFTRLVQETPIERAVRTVALRDGRRSEHTVTPAAAGLGSFTIDSDRLRERIEEWTDRIPPFDLSIRDLSSRARLGVNVQELTPELAEYFGAMDGVLVASVVADSPAGRAGLKAGDVITSLNGRSIRAGSELVRELRMISEGNVSVGIVRDKKPSTVNVQVDVQNRRARPERPLRQARPIRSTV